MLPLLELQESGIWGHRSLHPGVGPHVLRWLRVLHKGCLVTYGFFVDPATLLWDFPVHGVQASHLPCPFISCQPCSNTVKVVG